MRTRLDEIAEEEFGDNHPARAVVHFNAYPECRAAIKRAAERAFRHGVEQAHGVFAYLDHKNVQPAPVDTPCEWCWKPPHKYELCGHRYVPSRPVQPAPAEEKPKPCGCTGICITAPCTLWCQWPEKRHHGPCLDRRKGERRKGLEVVERLETPWVERRWWMRHWPNEANTHVDRRSGKDRRKG